MQATLSALAREGAPNSLVSREIAAQAVTDLGLDPEGKDPARA